MTSTPRRFAHAAARLIPLAALTLAVAACGLSRPSPDRQAFLLDPPASTNAQAAPQGAPALRVNRFVVAQPFDGKSLVYRLGDNRYEADFYNQFLAFPGTMLTEGTMAHLGSRGMFAAVVPMTSSLDARYVLEASVTGLYGDFRSGGAPAGVLAMRFLLARDDSGTGVVYDKLIEKRVPLAARTPAALVAGLDKAFGDVLAELEGDLRRLALREAAPRQDRTP